MLHIGGLDSLPNVTQVQSLNRDIYSTTKTRVDFTFHRSQYSSTVSVWRLHNAYVITACAHVSDFLNGAQLPMQKHLNKNAKVIATNIPWLSPQSG